MNEWGDRPNYTIRAASVRTDKSIRTIERWVHDGLRCRDVSGMVVIDHNDLMEWFRARMLSNPNRRTRQDS